MRFNSYSRAVAITKSDTVDFAEGPCDAIFAGGAGIIVALVGGSPVSFTVPAGAILPVIATRVNNTTTSATLMVALYI